MDDKIEKIFRDYDAITKGHFALKSMDQHSDTYVEKANLYKHPIVFHNLCYAIAEKVYAQHIEVDAVVGPSPIGAVIAQKVAFRLEKIYRLDEGLVSKNVLAIFTEKDVKGNHVFRKCFRKDLVGKKVLVVDDVLTTGASIVNILHVLSVEMKAQPAAIGVICNRSSNIEQIYHFPVMSLLQLELKSWKTEDCPLCAKGVPLDTKF